MISGCHNRKENILENLEGELLEYKTIGEFLADIKKKFDRGDEKSVKVVELRRLEQESKTMEEFVQEFGRILRDSGYKEKLLVEEFKKEINTIIYQRFMKLE